MNQVMNREKMRELLEQQSRGDEKMAEIGDVPQNTSVRVVIEDPQPVIAEASILGRQVSVRLVKALCSHGTTEFPFDYPCLARLYLPTEEGWEDHNDGYGESKWTYPGHGLRR